MKSGKVIQEFKFVTADAEKVYVWCTTNLLDTFVDFIQFVLDGSDKADEFYIIESKSGRVAKLVDLANHWGFRKRTFEERMNNTPTVRKEDLWIEKS